MNQDWTPVPIKPTQIRGSEVKAEKVKRVEKAEKAGKDAKVEKAEKARNQGTYADENANEVHLPSLHGKSCRNSI